MKILEKDKKKIRGRVVVTKTRHNLQWPTMTYDEPLQAKMSENEPYNELQNDRQ